MALSYQASGRSSGSACVGQRAGRPRACCGREGAEGARRSDSCPLTCPCSVWGAVKSSVALNLNSLGFPTTHNYVHSLPKASNTTTKINNLKKIRNEEIQNYMMAYNIS